MTGGRIAGAAATRTNVDEEEDDNIIFVMPTTPQTPQSHNRDDEVVLFSRIPPGTHTKAVTPDLKLKVRIDSVASLYGSLPMLTPIEEKQMYNEEDDDKADSCCADFFLFKVIE